MPGVQAREGQSYASLVGQFKKLPYPKNKRYHIQRSKKEREAVAAGKARFLKKIRREDSSLGTPYFTWSS